MKHENNRLRFGNVKEMIDDFKIEQLFPGQK